MKKRKRILSLLVTFCTLFTLLGIPRSVVLSAEPDDAVGVLSLPDIITEAEAAENGYVARVSAAETNLNTLVFRNADGTNTMRIFDHPVKFEDGGTVKDITLGIKASRGGFVSAQSPIRTVFPSRLSDGISLTYDGIEIEMIPEAASRTGTAAVLSGDGKKVTYAYGNRTALEYTLTYTGFKEDIVVEEYTGQTDFDFTLRTNGLILVSENGSYYLRDAAGKTKAALGDIIIFTADERNNAFGSMTHKTVTAGQEYVITVHVDDEYLKDEKTAYPIRIDPTVEIVYDGTNASAIEDVTLNSLGSSAPNSGSIYVGKRGNYGISRILMRFPGLDLSNIGSAYYITEARVELRDLMCYSTRLPVSCYSFKDAWTISTVRWSTISPNNYDTEEHDNKLVYYGNGDKNITGGTQRYSFDITQAVKWWKSGKYPQSAGVIFRTTDEIENGSTNVSVCFASYNRASNKPSFSMTYNTGISLTTFSYSMNIGERYDASKLILSCTPADATLKWSSSNSRVASINEDTGVISANACGKITITVRQSENPSISASFVLDIGAQVSRTYGISSGNVYMIKNISQGKYLTAGDSVTLSTKNSMNGNQLWYVKWEGNGYSLFSLGQKEPSSYGNYETRLRGCSTNATPSVLSQYYSSGSWSISYYANSYYITNSASSYHNTSLSVDSSSNVKMISLGNETSYARWAFEKIDSGTFNNYADGTLLGQYSKAYIKVKLCSSGEDSVYKNGIYQQSDFDAVKYWNGISSNVVIYGPNDTVPAGITPYVVTIKSASMIDKNIYGSTDVQTAYNTDAFDDDWEATTIFLNISVNDNDVASSEMLRKKIIAHEMGHALKLLHPKERECLYPNSNGRGNYLDDDSVLAIMNQGSPLDDNNKTAASPKWHDKINLINKWGE